MISVFHVITTIKRGGAENQLLILVKEQIKLGLDVHVAFLKDEPELLSDLVALGAHVHLELSTRGFLTQPIQLRKLIRRKKAVVHAHLPRAELVTLFTPENFTMIVSRHNTEAFFPKTPRLFSSFLSKLVTMRSAKVIAISEAVKKELIDFHEVWNTKKIEVVTYGYESQIKRSCNQRKFENRTLQLGTISRLAPQKDIPTMFNALQLIKEMGYSATLRIAGEGELEMSLKSEVISMNLQDCVTFVGRIEDPLRFISSMDVFLLTSKYEGFGLVLLEAMDAGVPIVASRNSAIPEVLGQDFPGLCESGDHKAFAEKVIKLGDQGYRSSILRIQQNRLKTFSAEKMARKINDLYFK